MESNPVVDPGALTPTAPEVSSAPADRVVRVVRTWGLPEVFLAAIVALWAFEFIRLPMLRYDRFGTFGFDLGIYDQGTWLLSRFHDPFVTIRGLELFGHHANIFLLFLVPLYWLGAGPITLLVVQVLAQASGAIAIFLLARDLLRSKWAGVALAAALLLNPTYQWLTWEFFHPDAVAIGPLLFAYWAARGKRWKLFAFAAVLAVLCKEDLALAVAVLGVIVWFRGDRRRGTVVAVASTIYFFFATRVLIPAENGIGPFYDSFFGDLGHSPTEVVFNSVRHPTKTWKLAEAHDRRTWYWNMFAPWAFVPLLDIRALAVGAGAIFINVVSSFPYTRDYRYHYSAIVVAGSALATVEAVAWISNRAKERNATMASLVTAVVVSAAVASALLGAAPYSRGYRKGIWPLQPDPHQAIRQRAVKSVPGGAAASVSYNLDTHMTHRSRIYEFPVPWCNINWGVRGEHLDDPAGVEYLLLERSLADSPRDKALLNDLLAHEFKIVSDDQGTLVAKRVRPPARPRGPNPPEGECFARPSLDSFQPDMQSGG
ncbi:MAG TPA: DUF2079 domain-containing protein [Acidimicrobiia bacterium]|jgi:uncharacterized membrane protein|nr:DUF2079 domain-containing protein [Acidimicrobiia bacterium]